jgi:hypothetical protein
MTTFLRVVNVTYLCVLVHTKLHSLNEIRNRNMITDGDKNLKRYFNTVFLYGDRRRPLETSALIASSRTRFKLHASRMCLMASVSETCSANQCRCIAYFYHPHFRQHSAGLVSCCFANLLGLGLAVAQAASFRLLTAAARARDRVRLCGIFGWQSGTRSCFLPILNFPCRSFHRLLQLITFIIRGWYSRSLTSVIIHSVPKEPARLTGAGVVRSRNTRPLSSPMHV